MATTLDAEPEDTIDGDPVGAPRRGPGAARTAAIIVGVVLVLFIALLATRKSSDDRFGPNPLRNQVVPKVAGLTLTGEYIDIDRFRGKWVVVNFFATWCIGCRVEHPELVKFTNAHRAAGDVQVVSVAFEDQPAAIKEFFDRQGGDWPVIINDNASTAISFGVTGIPESFVVAPNGLVVDNFTGVTAKDLDAVIDAYGGRGITSVGQNAPGTAAPVPAAGATPGTLATPP